VVAECAELNLVFLPGGLFVTTPSHADMLEKNGTAHPGLAPPLKKEQ
jgi:hypothetical protein